MASGEESTFGAAISFNLDRFVGACLEAAASANPLEAHAPAVAGGRGRMAAVIGLFEGVVTNYFYRRGRCSPRENNGQ
jgi:hypothetical protein